MKGYSVFMWILEGMFVFVKCLKKTCCSLFVKEIITILPRRCSMDSGSEVLCCAMLCVSGKVCYSLREFSLGINYLDSVLLDLII